MENDSIRPIGDSTVVDLWIHGKFRAVTVSREAIEVYLQVAPRDAASMTETDRREFVRTHLNVIATAAARRLEADPSMTIIAIAPGQLSRADSAASVEPPSDSGGATRDRRKQKLGPPGGIERRR